MSEDEPATANRIGHRLLAALRAGRHVWLPWIAALVVFPIAIQTAPEVFDFEAVEGGLLAVAAASAAVPLGLIVARPDLGWLISAGSALVLSQTIPVIDDDPWPWPVIHGLVLLALLFAVAFRPPATLATAQQVVTVVLVWLATVALFGLSVPSRLRAGWIVGVTVVFAAGLLLRWLRRRDGEPRQVNENLLPEGWPADLRQGFRTAFIDWVTSPRINRPMGERYVGNPRWLVWLRSALPWILALGVFWIGVAAIRETLAVHDLVLPVLAALIALPVGLLATRSLVGWRIITAVAVVLAVVGTPSGGLDPGTWPVILQVVWLSLIFVVSVRHDRWTTIWVWLATVLVMSAGIPDNPGASTTLIVAATALIYVGDLVRSRTRAARSLEEQTELSELEKARRTVLEEKARIARDLHDVVAHHMSMVVVQAETAPFRLTDLPDDAKAEFASISSSAREALGEIRGLLGVLRTDQQELARGPQPGMTEIRELVDEVSRSGASVSLDVTGTQRPTNAATGLSAYRIIQESLANAARHAPGARVDVTIHYGDNNLTLRIANDAAPRPVSPSPPGHGIIGMRERAAAAGGTLHAQPSPDGGFEVSASLPLDHEEAT